MILPEMPKTPKYPKHKTQAKFKFKTWLRKQNQNFNELLIYNKFVLEQGQKGQHTFFHSLSAFFQKIIFIINVVSTFFYSIPRLLDWIFMLEKRWIFSKKYFWSLQMIS